MINVLVLNELKEMAALSHDTGLGEVDRAEICQEYTVLEILFRSVNYILVARICKSFEENKPVW